MRGTKYCNELNALKNKTDITLGSSIKLLLTKKNIFLFNKDAFILKCGCKDLYYVLRYFYFK